MCRASVGVLLLALLAFEGCSTGEADINAPATFGQPCNADASTCESPFVCLRTHTIGSICTMTCSSNDDCPSWTATGHCAGPFQSTCALSLADGSSDSENVCMPMYCK